MKIANIERNDNLNRWEIILAEPGRASAVFVKDEVLSNPDDIKKLIEIYGKEFYEKILQIGRMLYNEAEEYVRGRIELEKKLKSYNKLASAYYKGGRLLEAEELWQRIIKEAEPQTIHLEFKN